MPSVQSPPPLRLMKFWLVSEVATAKRIMPKKAKIVAMARRINLTGHLASFSYSLRRVSAGSGIFESGGRCGVIIQKSRRDRREWKRSRCRMTGGEEMMTVRLMKRTSLKLAWQLPR